MIVSTRPIIAEPKGGTTIFKPKTRDALDPIISQGLQRHGLYHHTHCHYTFKYAMGTYLRKASITSSQMLKTTSEVWKSRAGSEPLPVKLHMTETARTTRTPFN